MTAYSLRLGIAKVLEPLIKQQATKPAQRHSLSNYKLPLWTAEQVRWEAVFFLFCFFVFCFFFNIKKKRKIQNWCYVPGILTYSCRQIWVFASLFSVWFHSFCLSLLALQSWTDVNVFHYAQNLVCNNRKNLKNCCLVSSLSVVSKNIYSKTSVAAFYRISMTCFALHSRIIVSRYMSQHWNGCTQKCEWQRYFASSGWWSVSLDPPWSVFCFQYRGLYSLPQTSISLLHFRHRRFAVWILTYL